MQPSPDMLRQIYEALLGHFGPRGWWPGESRLEIIIGAVLTQAVAWRNVKRAIDNLKSARLIDINALLDVDQEILAEQIRPALYHRQKSKKLKALMAYIADKYDGDLDLMFQEPLPKLREELLAVWGIGPETADSILLYAGDKLIFVVDAYTKRILHRLGLTDEDISYRDMQDFMEHHVPPDLYIYNEYHALLVGVGAGYCKKSKPRCPECPILKFCKYLTYLQEKY
jgi:endonuclease-3 related protein